MSDDTSPTLKGFGESANDEAWAKAHGLNPKAVAAWWGAHEKLTADDASRSSHGCQEAKVGDPAEDALFCTWGSRELLDLRTLTGFVVRNKKLTLVVELPLGSVQLDRAEDHQLDLAATLTSPVELELKERAPDNTPLVMAMSYCLDMEKKGVPVESMTPPQSGFPQPLRNCAGSKEALAGFGPAEKQNDRGWTDSIRHATKFITRACTSQLGFYAWKSGQFVRAARAGK